MVMRTSMARGWLLLAAALMTAVGAAACGSDGGATPTATQTSPTVATTVTVMEASASRGGQPTTVASLGNQADAAKKASDLLGFTVKPVNNLPGRFTVVAFTAHTSTSPAAPKGVEVFVQGTAGGILVSQTKGRQEQTGATPLETKLTGDYYKFEGATTVSYYLLTDSMTYGLAPQSPGTLTQDEALKVLSGFTT